MPLTNVAVWNLLQIDRFSSCSPWDFQTQSSSLSRFFFTFFIAKKVTKNLVLSKAFSGRKPMYNNGLFTRNPKPEAASVTLAYYSAPFVINLDSTIASRYCFHTLVLRTLGSGACGAFFQKALAFEKKNSKGVRYFNAANNCSIFYGVKYQYFEHQNTVKADFN